MLLLFSFFHFTPKFLPWLPRLFRFILASWLTSYFEIFLNRNYEWLAVVFLKIAVLMQSTNLETKFFQAARLLFCLCCLVFQLFLVLVQSFGHFYIVISPTFKFIFSFLNLYVYINHLSRC